MNNHPRKNFNKRNFLLISSVLLLSLLVFLAKHFVQIATGYYAKNICSCVLLAERDEGFVKENELGDYWFISAEVNKSKGLASASFLGMAQSEAYYRKGLGCTLLNGTDMETLDRQAEGFSRPQSDSIQALLPFVQDSVAEVRIDQERLEAALVTEFQKSSKKQTRAVAVFYDSMLVAERYADGFGQNTPLMGWSMSKSITATLVGMLIKEGKLSLSQNALFEEWENPTDPRRQLTLDHLLRMSSGLHFDEEYFFPSDATKMLFSSYSAAEIPLKKQLEYPIDTHWAYSSGTSNVVSQLLRNQFESQQAYWRYPYDSLFNKLGMRSMVMEPDASGTFVGSSFSYATARDWGRLGLLYLKQGKWNGEQLLPVGWADYVSTASTTAKEGQYGAHFWLKDTREPSEVWDQLPKDLYYMSGFNKQHVVIIPSRKLVIVRLSYSKTRDLGAFLLNVLSAFEKVELPVVTEGEEEPKEE